MAAAESRRYRVVWAAEGRPPIFLQDFPHWKFFKIEAQRFQSNYEMRQKSQRTAVRVNLDQTAPSS